MGIFDRMLGAKCDKCKVRLFKIKPGHSFFDKTDNRLSSSCKGMLHEQCELVGQWLRTLSYICNECHALVCSGCQPVGEVALVACPRCSSVMRSCGIVWDIASDARNTLTLVSLILEYKNKDAIAGAVYVLGKIGEMGDLSLDPLGGHLVMGWVAPLGAIIQASLHGNKTVRITARKALQKIEASEHGDETVRGAARAALQRIGL